jgi:hypothetical protein
VADALKQKVVVQERGKDGLSYKEAFDGREAVDKLAYIIKTTDRNLALLLGRALDAQKFFHDVTYDHRLRDSPLELYQFRERLAFVSTDKLPTPLDGRGYDELSRNASTASTLDDLKSHSTFPHGRPRRPSVTDTMLSDDVLSRPASSPSSPTATRPPAPGTACATRLHVHGGWSSKRASR